MALLAALIAGYWGWQRAAAWISLRHSVLVGAGITLGLLILLVSTGFPTWRFYDPPLIYRLAAFALIAPAAAYISYGLGAWLGKHVARLIARNPDA